MAAKVNTKFIMFLVLALFVGGGVVAGLYVMNVRHNAERSIRRGDEALKKGDLRAARDFYGRAVNKEPGNMGYLAKIEDVTLQIRPQTTDEAIQLYRNRLAILQHAARHDSQNPERYVRLLEELHDNARRSNMQWDLLQGPADDLMTRVPEDHPLRAVASTYKCLSIFRRPAVSTQEEILKTEAEMEAIVAKAPENDLAWGTLLFGQMLVFEKMGLEWNRPPHALEAQQQKIAQNVSRAMQAVPNGPEVAKMQLLFLTNERRIDRQSVSEEQIKAASDHLMATITDDATAGLVSECTNLLTSVPGDGQMRAIELEERFLKTNPEAHDLRLSMAALCFMNNQLDRAEQAALAIVDSEPMTVGYLTQLQLELRKRAAGLVVDVHSRRWAMAPVAERPMHAKRMDEARERLASLVVDKVNDMQLIRADARIAFTHNDFHKAAKLFDRLIRETPLAEDMETLYFAATSLQQIQQVGQAYERVEQALKIFPESENFLIFKARLELAMGRRQDAAQTVAKLQELANESDEVKSLTRAVESDGNAGSQDEGDPLTVVLTLANNHMMKGEVDEARQVVLAALNEDPGNLAIIKAMAFIESRSGQAEKAREYVEKGLELQPADLDLMRLRAILEHSDPIEAMVALHEDVFSDETQRSMSLMENLRALGRDQNQLAARLHAAKDEAGEHAAKALSDRALAEAKKWAEKVETLAPQHPRYLHYQFDTALDEKDWARAEVLVSRAIAVDADQAQGMFFKGRFELGRALEAAQAGRLDVSKKHYQDAIRSLETTTDRIRFSAPAWRALAFAYQNTGNFAHAIRAYEAAYKCNPTDLEGARAYMGLLLRRGEPIRALAVLREVRDLAPNDVQLRNLWLQVEAEHGDRSLAVNTRRAIYVQYPEDYANARELARLLTTTVPSQATILDNTGQPLFIEQRWTRMGADEREQAVARVKVDWDRQVNAIIEGLIKSQGEDIELVALRANLYRERGEIAKGGDLFRDFIARTPEEERTSLMYINLARHQVAATHIKEAIETLERGAKYQDAEIREIDHELSQTYMRLGHFAKAIEYVDEVLAVRPDYNLQQQAIECLVKTRQFDEAERRLQGMEGSGDEFISALLKASIVEGRGDELWEKGDITGARQQYAALRESIARAQATDPMNLKPRLLLAQFLVREYRRTGRTAELDDALALLDEADRLRNDVGDISLLRVNVLKERGDKVGAIGELARFVDRFPDQHSARSDLAQLHLEVGQIDAAFAVIDEGIKRNPTLAMWYEVQGDLHKVAKGDAAAALSSYNKAHILLPSVKTIFKVADATLAQPNPDCRALVIRLEASREHIESAPSVRELYGRALHCSNRAADAIEQFRLAYAARRKLIEDGLMEQTEISQWMLALARLYSNPERPNWVDASAVEQTALDICGTFGTHEYRVLSTIYRLAGDPTLSRSIDLQKQAISHCPPSETKLLIGLHNELGALYYTLRQMPEVIAVYEEILRIDPKNMEALNNVAYVLAEELKEPARAIPYVDRLMAQSTNNASVLDTAGWVYYLNGNNDKAKELLTNSFKTRKSIVAGMHLIEVLIKMNDSISALDYVDEVSRMNPDSETKAKLDEFEAEIRRLRGQ